jgi:hypothetical protein
VGERRGEGQRGGVHEYSIARLRMGSTKK